MLVRLATALALLSASPAVTYAGCLTGAAVGGVASHMAGHHGVLGAAAGCAVGHHHKAVKKKEQQQAQAQQQTQTGQPH